MLNCNSGNPAKIFAMMHEIQKQEFSSGILYRYCLGFEMTAIILQTAEYA